MSALNGRCLCGAVEFEATPTGQEMGVCHCSMCRRWSGGAWFGVDCGNSVKVADEGQLGVYKSSDWGERCFCKSCGSTLFWRLQSGAHHVVSVQTFDDAGQFMFANEIYTDEQPRNYAFSNATKRMTGAEFLAAFMASSGSSGNG
jgi:hypothetical protein